MSNTQSNIRRNDTVDNSRERTQRVPATTNPRRPTSNRQESSAARHPTSMLEGEIVPPTAHLTHRPGAQVPTELQRQIAAAQISNTRTHTSRPLNRDPTLPTHPRTDARHVPPAPHIELNPNILIFGETGAGKSSILNMLAGSPVASISPDAEGHTFASTPYSITIPVPIPINGTADDTNGTDGPVTLTFWDTAGLSEGEHGTVPAAQAMKHLQDLVGNLHARGGGVSLLVFCIRAARFREIWKINYDLFAGVICQHRVPVVLVVNGLENESPMESWWIENGAELEGRGMAFCAHACVASTRGKKRRDGGFMYEEEYEESVRALRRVVGEHFLREPWVVDGARWLDEIAVKMAGYYEVGSGEGSGRLGDGRESEARLQQHQEHQHQERQHIGGGGIGVYPVLSLVIEKFFQVVQNVLMPTRVQPRRTEPRRRRN